MRTFEPNWGKTFFGSRRIGKFLEIHFGFGTIKICREALITQAQAAAARITQNELFTQDPSTRPRRKDGKWKRWNLPDA